MEDGGGERAREGEREREREREDRSNKKQTTNVSLPGKPHLEVFYTRQLIQTHTHTQ